MAEQLRQRVGVYLDFDNIVISRYNQLHGHNQFALDKARYHAKSNPKADAQVTARIQRAMIDVGAILDYAATFGSIVISRAYADWSATVNTRYQKQLIDRAVDLIQLFPAALSLKNGADIRLAIDVVEDMFRLEDVTHIVIVAGDSDYIPLAQRCKKLGRYVVGIGVSGSTSRSLAAVCDEFADYDALPGVPSVVAVPIAAMVTPVTPSSKKKPAQAVKAKVAASVVATVAPTLSKAATVRARKAATALLLQAMEQLSAEGKQWHNASAVKVQIRSLDPSFEEKLLGHKSFSDFLRSRHAVVELEQKSPTSLLLRLRLRLRLRG